MKIRVRCLVPCRDVHLPAATPCVCQTINYTDFVHNDHRLLMSSLWNTEQQANRTRMHLLFVAE